MREHSCVGLVTNSSSETFVFRGYTSAKVLNTLLDTMWTSWAHRNRAELLQWAQWEHKAACEGLDDDAIFARFAFCCPVNAYEGDVWVELSVMMTGNDLPSGFEQFMDEVLDIGYRGY